jgi:hypothetical protein
VGPISRPAPVPRDPETPADAVSLPAPNDTPAEKPVRSTARKIEV